MISTHLLSLLILRFHTGAQALAKMIDRMAVTILILVKPQVPTITGAVVCKVAACLVDGANETIRQDELAIRPHLRIDVTLTAEIQSLPWFDQSSFEQAASPAAAAKPPTNCRLFIPCTLRAAESAASVCAGTGPRQCPTIFDFLA